MNIRHISALVLCYYLENMREHLQEVTDAFNELEDGGYRIYQHTAHKLSQTRTIVLQQLQA